MHEVTFIKILFTIKAKQKIVLISFHSFVFVSEESAIKHLGAINTIFNPN